MSKYAQTFKRTESVYKYDSKTHTVVDSGEEVDLQARVNSHYDELFYTRLEQYFGTSVNPVIVDGVDDYMESTGCNADRVLDALQTVERFRAIHSIPETYSITEALQFLRTKATNTTNITNTEKEVFKDEKESSFEEGEQA